MRESSTKLSQELQAERENLKEFANKEKQSFISEIESLKNRLSEISDSHCKLAKECDSLKSSYRIEQNLRKKLHNQVCQIKIDSQH